MEDEDRDDSSSPRGRGGGRRGAGSGGGGSGGRSHERDRWGGRGGLFAEGDSFNSTWVSLGLSLERHHFTNACPAAPSTAAPSSETANPQRGMDTSPGAVVPAVACVLGGPSPHPRDCKSYQ
eukprot:Hpha_TRINITY_DN6014_c0_g1::TRINITY_DN6014_c0_g1_i1::g.63420::m.63420